EREDADADSSFRQRLPRADRAGRAMVPRAAASRRAERDRLLPAREPQPHAHRRAEAPGREYRVAGLLVRPIPERQPERRAAGRTGSRGAHELPRSFVDDRETLLTNPSSISESPVRS